MLFGLRGSHHLNTNGLFASEVNQFIAGIDCVNTRDHPCNIIHVFVDRNRLNIFNRMML